MSSLAADFAGNPDATFIANDTLRSDRIRLIEGKDGGYTELQGAADMVLEVVSDSSVDKDFVTLRQAYWKPASANTGSSMSANVRLFLTFSTTPAAVTQPAARKTAGSSPKSSARASV